MPLSTGTKVGLSPGDSVLGGTQPPPHNWGGAPFPIFSPFLCGQTYGCIKMPLGMEVGLSPGDFVLDGDPAPTQKGGGAQGQSPQFSAYYYCGQKRLDGSWHGGRPWSSPHCARWGHNSPPQKGGRAPNFRPIFIVAKRLDASRSHLVGR